MSPTPHPPAPARPSATSILVRQNNAAIEVYLLRRSQASSAFPGFYVFPGGTLDSDDMDIAFWRGHVDRLSDGFSVAPDDSGVAPLLPFAVAAIRETFEEAGLLLAAPVGERTPARLDRRGKKPFSRQIADNGLRLRVSALTVWSRWITPEAMSKRFDTIFFIVPVTRNQDCRPDNHETTHGMWIDPVHALNENDAGRCPLSPPTLVTLHRLHACRDLDQLLDAARRRDWQSPIMPRMLKFDGGALIIEPWDAEYRSPVISVAVDGLHTRILPSHAPFSRLWLHRGCWRPVAGPSSVGENQ